MDNLCHTLTGAALGEAGLKHRTRFGNAALMIAANLPDIDVLAFAASTPTVALRRGWTHGVLAQALLPILLAMTLIAIDRWRPPALRQAQGRPERNRGTRGGGVPARAGALLLLGYIGVLSHVAMDWLNNYGVRLLMPFSGRWFYGDAIFIVDPWLWLILAGGAILARKAGRGRIASAAVLMATVYVLAMVVSARAARAHTVDAWRTTEGRPPAALMVGPVLINPLRKVVIVDAGDHYRRGTFRWMPRRLDLDRAPVPKQDRHPAVTQARTEPEFRAILVWSRFPYYELTRTPEGTRVTLADMRFGPRLFNATTVVPHRGP
jgi:inner membrane protein